MEDVKTITNDKLELSNINNFVHPFNSYYKLNMTMNNLGKVDIEIIKLYSNDEIILSVAVVDDYFTIDYSIITYNESLHHNLWRLVTNG